METIATQVYRHKKKEVSSSEEESSMTVNDEMSVPDEGVKETNESERASDPSSDKNSNNSNNGDSLEAEQSDFEEEIQGNSVSDQDD